MTHRLPRLLVAASLGMTALLSVPAHAQRPLQDIINDALQGCYGAAVIVCDPHVTGSPVGTSSTTVPVCAGSCQNVDVPVPTGAEGPTCVGFSDQDGNTTEECVYPIHWEETQ